MINRGRVVVVGSMNIDMITYCDRFPDDGETLVGSSYVQGFGGKGANQAVMAARLGADVTFVGCVGDDDLGRATIANFTERGIDVTGIDVLEDQRTGVAPIWVDRDGTNRILIVLGANLALTGEHVRDRLGRIEDVGVVVAQLETPQDATLAAFEWAKSNDATTVLNPAPGEVVRDDLLAVTDWLIPNETEFVILAGEDADESSVASWSETWRSGVIVTLGGDGALVADGVNAPWRQPARSVNVVDTTGAGDAFVGAYAAGLASGTTLAEALVLANACGGLATTREGTQSSYPDVADLVSIGVEVPTW